MSPEELATLHLNPKQLNPALSGKGGVNTSLMRPVGCDACEGLGFQGRVGIFELFVMNEAIRPLVLERKTVSEVREVARTAGMQTLRENGLAKALEGETTVEEILRETQDYD